MNRYGGSGQGFNDQSIIDEYIRYYNFSSGSGGSRKNYGGGIIGIQAETIYHAGTIDSSGSSLNSNSGGSGGRHFFTLFD